MENGFIAHNDAARAALHATVEALSYEQFEASVEGGWTVKALLAHLAWWDRYQVALMREWAAGGFETDINTPAMRGGGFASEYDNAAGMAEWLVLPAAWVRDEVLRAAEEADATSADVHERLGEVGRMELLPRVADRSAHRLEHLGQITKAIEPREHSAG